MPEKDVDLLLAQAERVRFTPQAQREGLALLEAFVPFHLGKEPRSLHFLRQIRGRPTPGLEREVRPAGKGR